MPVSPIPATIPNRPSDRTPERTSERLPALATHATVPDRTPEAPRRLDYTLLSGPPLTPEQLKKLRKMPEAPPDQPAFHMSVVDRSATLEERKMPRGASQSSVNVTSRQAAERQPISASMGSHAPVPFFTGRQQDQPLAASDSFGASNLPRNPQSTSSSAISRKPLLSSSSYPADVLVATGPKRSRAPTYPAVISRKAVPTASGTFQTTSPSTNLAPSLTVVSGTSLPSNSSNVLETSKPSKNNQTTSSAAVSGEDTFVSSLSELFATPGPTVPTLSAQERFRRRFQPARSNTRDVFGDYQPVRPFGLDMSGVSSVEKLGTTTTTTPQVLESEHVSDTDSYETDSFGAKSFDGEWFINPLDMHAPGNTLDQNAPLNVLRRQPSSDAVSTPSHNRPSPYPAPTTALPALPLSSNVFGVQAPVEVQYDQPWNVPRAPRLPRAPVPAHGPRREISSNVPARQGLENMIRGQASVNDVDVPTPAPRQRGQTISNVQSGQVHVEKVRRQPSSNVLREEASGQVVRPQAAETSNAPDSGSKVRRMRALFEPSGSPQTTDTTGERQAPRRRGSPTRAMVEGSVAIRRVAFAEEAEGPQTYHYRHPRPLAGDHANPFATPPPAVRAGSQEIRDAESVSGGTSQGGGRRSESGRGGEGKE